MTRRGALQVSLGEIERIQSGADGQPVKAQKNLSGQIGVAAGGVAVVHGDVKAPAQVIEFKASDGLTAKHPGGFEAEREAHGVDRPHSVMLKVVSSGGRCDDAAIKTDVMADKNRVFGILEKCADGGGFIDAGRGFIERNPVHQHGRSGVVGL